MEYVLLGLVLLLTALVVNLYLSMRHYKRVDYKSLLEEELRQKASDQQMAELAAMLAEAKRERNDLSSEIQRLFARQRQPERIHFENHPIYPQRSTEPRTAVEFTSMVYQEAARMLDDGAEPWKVAQQLRLTMTEVETLSRLREVRDSISADLPA
jgi:hypothetical protein